MESDTAEIYVLVLRHCVKMAMGKNYNYLYLKNAWINSVVYDFIVFQVSRN